MSAAQSLKEEILARSNARKRATTGGLWQVLDDMRRKGVRRFTVAQVGRHAEAAGVLRTQTLRNAGGEDYRALIDAFAKEIGIPTTALSTAPATPLAEAVEAIQDLDIRTRLKMVLVENGRQRAEISRLRQAFKHLQPALKEEQQATKPLLPVASTPVDVAPIEKFLSAAWLEERRWTVEPNGALFDEAGECLGPVGFVGALFALCHQEASKR